MSVDTLKIQKAYEQILTEGRLQNMLAVGIMGVSLLGAAATSLLIDKYGEPNTADVYTNPKGREYTPEISEIELGKYLQFCNKNQKFSHNQLDLIKRGILHVGEKVTTNAQAKQLLLVIKDVIQNDEDEEQTLKRIENTLEFGFNK